MPKDKKRDMWIYEEEFAQFTKDMDEASNAGPKAVLSCLSKGIMIVDRNSNMLKKFMIQDAASRLEKYDTVIKTQDICNTITQQLRGKVHPRYVRRCLDKKYKNKEKSDFASNQGKSKPKEVKTPAALWPLNLDVRNQQKDKIILPPPSPPLVKSGLTSVSESPVQNDPFSSTSNDIGYSLSAREDSGSRSSHCSSSVLIRFPAAPNPAYPELKGNLAWPVQEGSKTRVITVILPEDSVREIKAIEDAIIGLKVARASGSVVNEVIAAPSLTWVT